MISNYLISTSSQKILQYLLISDGEQYYGNEIAKSVNISFSAANGVLRKMHKDRIINKISKGKICFYSLNKNHIYVKEMKILAHLILLEPIIEKLKSCCYKIVLFGSVLSGESTYESDIDLFIVSTRKNDVMAIIDKYSEKKRIYNKKLQVIVENPVSLLKKNPNSEIFMQEINKGMVIWEGRNGDF